MIFIKLFKFIFSNFFPSCLKSKPCYLKSKEKENKFEENLKLYPWQRGGSFRIPLVFLNIDLFIWFLVFPEVET